MDMFTAILLTIITAATPLLLAALGELVTERSGVLNLGVEGMMVMGAVSGFGAAFLSGSPYVGILAAIAAGMAMAVLFGFLTLTLVANQVAAGLALTLLGLGLSGLIGESFVGQPLRQARQCFRHRHPGARVFAPAYGGRFLCPVPHQGRPDHPCCRRQSWLGPCAGLRCHCCPLSCVLFGGACAGLAGGYLSLVYTPQWVENMTAGRGWIALALVVFASWLPWRTCAGAYLFGAISILAYTVQTLGWGIPSQFLSSLPYLVTIAALVVISGNRLLTRANTPACLGQAFVPDR